MKLTLPLALIFSLHLLDAAPIPSKYRNTLSADYHYCYFAAYQPGQRIAFTSKPKATPQRLSNPHFPSHQVFSPSSSSASAHQVAEQAFNNVPITPSKRLDRRQALSAEFPLESSYLLSLSNTATILEQEGRFPKAISATNALAAKATSALPGLRIEDAKRYWGTLPHGSPLGEHEGYDEIVVGDSLATLRSTRICADDFASEGFYSREPTKSYDDILVVGILVLFLVAVVAWEAAEIVGHMFVPLAFGLLFISNTADNMCLYNFCGIRQKTTLRHRRLRR
ncbi:hypothetical protein F5882DRAFT_439393 [Hyaloscypha sp. PMI_1271]|nr:hypothetical protein F5882DRAFT_439393 [Hyaloscypha sp. PMI_1271]